MEDNNIKQLPCSRITQTEDIKLFRKEEYTYCINKMYMSMYMSKLRYLRLKYTFSSRISHSRKLLQLEKCRIPVAA
jgi:hypothetical protein